MRRKCSKFTWWSYRTWNIFFSVIWIQTRTFRVPCPLQRIRCWNISITRRLSRTTRYSCKIKRMRRILLRKSNVDGLKRIILHLNVRPNCRSFPLRWILSANLIKSGFLCEINQHKNICLRIRADFLGAACNKLNTGTPDEGTHKGSVFSSLLGCRDSAYPDSD